MRSILRLLQHRNRFVSPPTASYERQGSSYGNGCHTYTQYNYLRPGVASFIRKAHFDHALEMAKRHAPRALTAVDFGCADGVFLPSLAGSYQRVIGIDIRPDFVEIANDMLQTSGITNATALTSTDLTRNELLARHGASDVAFSLEVLEHAGDPADMWPSKLRVIDEVFALLAPGGILIASVPNMVGLPFLVQRLGLWATGSMREPIDWNELLRASLARDTRSLEAKWNGQHLGFSHLRFEEAMRTSRFTIVERRDIFFQLLYVIARRADA